MTFLYIFNLIFVIIAITYLGEVYARKNQSHLYTHL